MTGLTRWLVFALVAMSFFLALAVRQDDANFASEVQGRIATEVPRTRGHLTPKEPKGTHPICEGIYAGDGKTCRTQVRVTDPAQCGQVWALWSPELKEEGTWGGEKGTILQDAQAVFVQCAKAFHMMSAEGKSPCWEHAGYYEEGTPEDIEQQQCSAPGINAKLRCDDEKPAVATAEAVPLQSAVKKEYEGNVYFEADTVTDATTEAYIEATKTKLCDSGCRPRSDCTSYFNFPINDMVVAAADNFADLAHWSEAIGSRMYHLFTRAKMVVGRDRAEALRKWDHKHGVEGADIAF